MDPSSFCGYVNAVVLCYNSKGGAVPFYPHCRVTFPDFTKWTTVYTQKYRTFLAKNPKPLRRVLQESDLELLATVLENENVVEIQKFNAVIIGFRTGLRAETLRNLTFDCLGDLTADIITPCIANAKNVQATLETADMQFFRRPIMKSPDARFCAVEAFKRQLKLVGDKKDAENNWIFRAASRNGKALLAEQASKNLFRAGADMVSRKLGIATGKLVWRDVARRAVFTRLANTPGFSIPQTAKFLGVRPDIVQIYNQELEGDNLRAAKAVAGIQEKEEASSSSSLLRKKPEDAPKLEPVQISQAPKAEIVPDPGVKTEDVVLLDADAENAQDVFDVDAWEDYDKYPLTQRDISKFPVFNVDEENVNFDEEMVLTFKNRGDPETKHGSQCAVCDETDDADKSPFVKWIMCESCGGWFHLKCLGMGNIPIGKWYCKGCRIAARTSSTPVKQDKRQRHRKATKSDDFEYDLTQLSL
jgi:hypothetical protein